MDYLTHRPFQQGELIMVIDIPDTNYPLAMFIWFPLHFITYTNQTYKVMLHLETYFEYVTAFTSPQPIISNRGYRRHITMVRHAQQLNHSGDAPLKPVDLTWFRFDYDHLVSSPYLRCRQTAELLNYKQANIVIDIRIREQNGHKTTKQVLTLHPSTAAYNITIGRDESWASFNGRVSEFWQELMQHTTGNVLIVTHGLVVKACYEWLTGTVRWRQGRDVPYVEGFTYRM